MDADVRRADDQLRPRHHDPRAPVEHARIPAPARAGGIAGRRPSRGGHLSGQQRAESGHRTSVPPCDRAVRVLPQGTRCRAQLVVGGRFGQRRPLAHRLGELPMGVTAWTGPLVDGRELYRFFHIGDDETFALRGVSVSVHAGEMVAVVGPSGSGKSTLLACLAGLDEPDGGHVTIAGQRITRRDEATRARLRAWWIGMLLQSGNLLEHLSVAQNIGAAQALAARAPRGQPLAGTGPATGPGADGSRPDGQTLLDDVGLGERATARPSMLSGGEAARAGLAVAMA